MNTSIQHGRVLIIDDNVDAGEMLGTLLTLEGYDCRVAGNGIAGMALFFEFQPQVVLCDLQMPGMSGFEFAKNVRRLEHRPVSLVALSGADAFGMKAMVRDAGFDILLVKPASFDQVHSTLKALLGGRQKR